MSAPTAGYCGKPLSQKLGIRDGMRLAFVGAPDDVVSLLDPLPPSVRIATSDEEADPDLILLFARSIAELAEAFPRHARRLQAAGMLWVAWPKRASGVPTDLTEDRVREIGLAAGLVDVKVCAIDATWSGLKFVYRLKDRGRRGGSGS